MRCLLFANGIIENPSYIKHQIKKDDVIIALDGGLKYIDILGIVPNFLIGDFDSVDKNTLERYIQMGCEVFQHPSRKDFTDMELGIDFAVTKGYDEIVIMGALGGRLDHTLGNVHAMVQALNKGIKVWVCGENEDVYLIDSEIDLWYKEGAVVSLVPLTEEVQGVTTFNLEYPLKKETLYMGYGRGISNVFKNDWAKVTICSGMLIVIVNKTSV